jgi:AcrR family transcriptional regulator
MDGTLSAGTLPLLEAANQRAAVPKAPDAGLLPPRTTASGSLRRILETSLTLFGEQGFHAISVRDIAGALGMQPSSLYSHVRSKQELLAQLIRTGHEEHRALVTAALEACSEDPAEQLVAVTRAHVQLHTSYPLLARVCNRELASLAEEDKGDILAIRLDSERLIADVVERGQRLGMFQPVEPLLAVAAIGAMGIRTADWWGPESGVSAEQVAETYGHFALRMLT